jgi:hypothetical protein
VRGVVLRDTMTPDVPRSSRCTMPGRSLAADAAEIGDVVEQSVDERARRMTAPGWTTIPAGLLTTTMSASS